MNVLVYLEEVNGALRRASLEAVTAAKSVAGDGAVTGVIINGSDVAINSGAAYGLSNCLNVTGEGFDSHANSNVATAIAAAAMTSNSAVVFVSANSTGKDVAPRVAVKLDAGLLTDCVEVHAAGETVEAVRPVYAGKAMIRVKASTALTVVTLRPNVFTAKAGSTGTVASSPLTVDTTGSRSSVVTNVVKNEGALDVAEADIIVSGGRGLKGPENFHLIENLAKSLGAAVGASRAVVDAGWRPHGEQVGQTGKTVSPSMYVACGISGAVQHLAGMSSSKIIVAINKDSEAPIFKVADYGIVGDVFEVLPALTEKIATITGKS